MSIDEWWNRSAQSLLNRQNALFDVRCWTFDVRRSLVCFVIRPAVPYPACDELSRIEATPREKNFPNLQFRLARVGIH